MSGSARLTLDTLGESEVIALGGVGTVGLSRLLGNQKDRERHRHDEKERRPYHRESNFVVSDRAADLTAYHLRR